MSREQYVEKQQTTVIGYCRVCGAPIYGYPGSKQELCIIHQREADIIKMLRQERLD